MAEVSRQNRPKSSAFHNLLFILLLGRRYLHKCLFFKQAKRSSLIYHPIRHPVAVNAFPALPIVIVLSYIRGKLANLIILCQSEYIALKCENTEKNNTKKQFKNPTIRALHRQVPTNLFPQQCEPTVQVPSVRKACQLDYLDLLAQAFSFLL